MPLFSPYINIHIFSTLDNKYNLSQIIVIWGDERIELAFLCLMTGSEISLVNSFGMLFAMCQLVIFLTVLSSDGLLSVRDAGHFRYFFPKKKFPVYRLPWCVITLLLYYINNCHRIFIT